MFDIHSALIFGHTTIAVEGAAAFLIWHSHRHLPGIKKTFLAYVLKPISAGLIFFHRDMFGIVLGNTGANVAAVLCLISLAEMLDSPKVPNWVISATILLSMVFWGGALVLAPDQVLGRVVAKSLFDAVVVGWMFRQTIVTPPRLLADKIGLLFIFSIHMVFIVVRLGMAIADGNQSLISTPFPAWYSLEVSLYSNLLFFCLILIALHRLSVPDLSATATATSGGAGAANTWSLCAATWELVPPDDAPIKLTSMEFDFLAALSKTPGEACSREMIFSSFHRSTSPNDRNLDALVRRIRLKVKNASGQKLPVKTIYGVGFTFTAPLQQINA